MTEELRQELEALDREGLIRRAEAAGIRRARILTRPEIVDELLRRDSSADPATLRRTRGFFGLARDLLARVVERGLHLPDAADRIRTIGDEGPVAPRVELEVVPTVTLAEIYAAQGHKERAVETLEAVLEREPDHASARTLYAKLTDAAYVPPEPPLPPEPEIEPSVFPAEEPEPETETANVTGAESEPVPVPVPVPVPDLAPVSALPSEDAETPRRVRPRARPVCVVVPAAARSWLVTWEGLPEAHERPPGAFVVRVAIVEPSWDGPRTVVRDVAADERDGELFLERIPSRALVRAAVGVGRDEAFVPFATADLLERAAETSGAGLGLARFGLEGPLSIDEGDPAFSPVSRAVARARARAPRQMTSSG